MKPKDRLEAPVQWPDIEPLDLGVGVRQLLKMPLRSTDTSDLDES